jgi:hypothetical protein
MCVHRIFLNLFVLWLSSMLLALVTHFLYFDAPSPKFIQVLQLGTLLASSVLYLAVRGLELGKNFVTIAGAGWLIGFYVYFGLIRASVDLSEAMLILLGISILLNLALNVAFKKKAPHYHFAAGAKTSSLGDRGSGARFSRQQT